MIGPEPICTRCRHLDRSDRPLGEPPRCAAFPVEIPDAIYVGGFNHRKPFEGDHGIRFEAIEEVAQDAPAA